MSDELAKAKATSLRERSKLVLHCGNIASWSKLKKRAILTSTEEVSDRENVYLPSIPIPLSCTDTRLYLP